MEPDYSNPTIYHSSEIWAGEEEGHMAPCNYVTLTTYEELYEAYEELKFRMGGLEK